MKKLEPETGMFTRLWAERVFIIWSPKRSNLLKTDSGKLCKNDKHVDYYWKPRQNWY